VLGSLNAKLLLRLAFLAFQSKNDLTRRLGLFVKDWLCLSTETHLFAIVTAFALRKITRLAGFVLCYLVHFVLLALSRAVRSAFFGNIHHFI
jgi:hypothetical protein